MGRFRLEKKAVRFLEGAFVGWGERVRFVRKRESVGKI